MSRGKKNEIKKPPQQKDFETIYSLAEKLSWKDSSLSSQLQS